MSSCYIKRGKTYFVRNIYGSQNHWVLFKEEAKKYPTIRQARQVIRQYKLKNVEIEKA